MASKELLIAFARGYHSAIIRDNTLPEDIAEHQSQRKAWRAGNKRGQEVVVYHKTSLKRHRDLATQINLGANYRPERWM